jgi:transcriptional regulator with XRE-family HTH domain
MPINSDGMSTIDKLAEQRVKFRISQKKIADHLGVTKSTMNRYEKGSREISLANAEKYADKLGYELKLIVK